MENKNGKKNNCMDIQAKKQAKFLTRKLEYSKERGTLKEKINLF